VSGTEGSNGWYTSNVWVELSAQDTTSGVAAIYYRLPGGTDTEYTNPFQYGYEGETTIKFWAVDVAGNVATEIDLNVKIDKQLPTTTHSLPAVDGENDWYVTPATITFAPADPVPGSGVVSTSYEVYFNTALMSSGTLTGASPTLTLGSAPLYFGDGTYDVLYNSIDEAGNVQDPISVTARIDKTAPVPAPIITGPNGGNNFTANDTSFVLEGTCPLDTNVILVNGTSEGVTLSQAEGTWSKPISIGPDQIPYTFTVNAKDIAGNVGQNDSIIITYDSVGPVVTVSEPITPTRFSVATVEGTTENNNDTVWVKVNGSELYSATGSTNWQITVNLTPNFNNEIAVWAEDVLDNVGPTVNKQIFCDQIPPQTPTLVVVTPTNEGSPVISGTCDPTDTTEVKIFMTRPDSVVTEYTVAISGSTNWQQEVSFVNEGEYFFEVYAIDEAGNWSVVAAMGMILYDYSGPVADNGIKINGDDEYTNTLNTTLTLVADSGLTDITTVKVRNASENWITFDYETTNEAWNPWMLIDAADGIRTVEAQFTDRAGNNSVIYTDTIVYDSTAPTIDEIILNDSNLLDEELLAKNPGIDLKVTNPTPIIEVLTLDNYTDFTTEMQLVEIEFVNDSATISIIDAPTPASGKVNFTVDDANQIPAGSYTMRITVTDLAGNTTIREIEGINVTGGDPIITSQVIAAPNPFNPPLEGEDPENTMKIYFTVAGDPTAQVGIYLHDSTGRLVWKKILPAQQLLDDKGVEWTGYTQFGEIAENGVYLLRVVDETNKKLIGKTKIVIIKKKSQ